MACLFVSKNYSFTEKKWPLCSIGFRLVRAPLSFTSMAPAVADEIVIEILNFALYLFVLYKSNVTYMNFCVNQAHLNLTSRIALEQCIKLTKIMLHVAIVHCVCFTIVYATLYLIVLLQNFYVIQRHHVDFEVLFNQGPVMVFMDAFAFICLWEIPALKKKFRRFFQSLKVGPIGVVTSMNQNAMKLKEGDIRIKYLTEQWDAAYPVKRKQTKYEK